MFCSRDRVPQTKLEHQLAEASAKAEALGARVGEEQAAREGAESEASIAAQRLRQAESITAYVTSAKSNESGEIDPGREGGGIAILL